jgi:hypothetical protein
MPTAHVVATASSEATLHLTNGDSVGNSLRESKLPGAVLPWQDVLHEGPLAPVGASELRELRASFLSAQGWGAQAAIQGDLERRDELLLDALTTGRHLVLWFEHDLFDQLQVLQILSLVAESGAALESIELLIVGEVDGRPDFKGLGELSPDDLLALWERRQPLTRDVLDLGASAWTALCGPDPRAIEALLGRDTSALPYLGPALRRLLEELPDTVNGLSRTERQALEAIEAGAQTAGQVFLATGAREEAPFLGDATMWVRLHELGQGERRLIETATGTALPAPPALGNDGFWSTPLVLTEAGRDVLAGGLDRVEAIAIDRWVGGTHLRPGNVWRWDRASESVIAPR